jgi:hypothetical protein
MEAEDIKETMKAEQCSAEEAIRIRKENEELTKIIEHYCIQSMQLCSSTLKDLRKLQKVGHDKAADDPHVQERG